MLLNHSECITRSRHYLYKSQVALVRNIAQLSGGKQKQLLKNRHGYYLSKNIRDNLAAKYGQRQITTEVDKLLANLPNQISDFNERVFLNESLACFRCGAFRASIVMCWNLAFDHLSS